MYYFSEKDSFLAMKIRFPFDRYRQILDDRFRAGWLAGMGEILCSRNQAAWFEAFPQALGNGFAGLRHCFETDIRRFYRSDVLGTGIRKSAFGRQVGIEAAPGIVMVRLHSLGNNGSSSRAGGGDIS